MARHRSRAVLAGSRQLMPVPSNKELAAEAGRRVSRLFKAERHDLSWSFWITHPNEGGTRRLCVAGPYWQAVDARRIAMRDIQLALRAALG